MERPVRRSPGRALLSVWFEIGFLLSVQHHPTKTRNLRIYGVFLSGVQLRGGTSIDIRGQLGANLGAETIFQNQLPPICP